MLLHPLTSPQLFQFLAPFFQEDSLPQATGFTLGLEEAEDIVLANGSLDVSDDRSGLVVHELDADLGNTTARAGTAEDTSDLHELDGLLGGIHFG